MREGVLVKVFCIRSEGGCFGESIMYQRSAVVKVFFIRRDEGAVVKVFYIRSEGRCFGEGLLHQE